jgi:hypothetical protein
VRPVLLACFSSCPSTKAIPSCVLGETQVSPTLMTSFNRNHVSKGAISKSITVKGREQHMNFEGHNSIHYGTKVECWDMHGERLFLLTVWEPGNEG